MKYLSRIARLCEICTALFLITLLNIVLETRLTESTPPLRIQSVAHAQPLIQLALNPLDFSPTVALQVGHWKTADVPQELAHIRDHNGATGGGKMEWEVNYAIAQKTAQILQSQGIAVDILPATVPPGYTADAFIAIHADGNDDPQRSGFKVASSWRDTSGKASLLVTSLQKMYENATHLPLDPEITKNMTGYYAFSWWRFHHAISPATTGAIIETGFLTSKKDRKIILGEQDRVAEGIANGVILFLNQTLQPQEAHLDNQLENTT